jgi:hypothetical protein
MRKTIEVAFATIILALCLTKAAGAPIEGKWIGTINGQKAMTLTVSEVGGKLSGHMVMYVVDKKFGEPDARVVGQDDRELSGVKWDGKVLRFAVHDPDADFEMTVSGPNNAVLKTSSSGLTAPMRRQ